MIGVGLSWNAVNELDYVGALCCKNHKRVSYKRNLLGHVDESLVVVEP